MATAIFEVDTKEFESRALNWAQEFDEVCFLQSNGYADDYTKVDRLLAVKAVEVFASTTGKSAFDGLETFRAKHPHRWMPGFLSYDLKDEIEGLGNDLPEGIAFPKAYFFIPETVIRFYLNHVEIEADDPHAIFRAIERHDGPATNTANQNIPISISKRFSKTEYLQAFDRLQWHIQRGDVYEVNLCQEFYAEGISLNPLELYKRLNALSPTPFACFFKLGRQYILCASPERFLAKRGDTLISQPIKGTARRGRDSAEDAEIIARLRGNPKEIAENVMIVDLVRNDLTRSAQPGSVKVSRHLEVHTFRQVHQLISTITCLKRPDISDIEVIRNTFPAGSMTGAPKISAMSLCDRYEGSKRGIYSGAVGYFAPDGDFDLNVVIRSVLYDSSASFLSFHTGGAITLEARGETEYEECLLKASAIVAALNTSIAH